MGAFSLFYGIEVPTVIFFSSAVDALPVDANGIRTIVALRDAHSTPTYPIAMFLSLAFEHHSSFMQQRTRRQGHAGIADLGALEVVDGVGICLVEMEVGGGGMVVAEFPSDGMAILRERDRT